MRARVEMVPLNRVAVTAFVVSMVVGFLVTALIRNPIPLIVGVLIGVYLLFAIKVVQQWEKVALLRDELKVDYAFNYRNGEPLEHLEKGAPEGIDAYFDNTGGPQLEAALSSLRNFGRVALCGGVAGYNTPVTGPRNIILAIGKRLRLEGFIVSDHVKEMPLFLAEALPALQSGALTSHETFVHGLEAAPAALLDILHPGAANMGKMIVKLSN